MNAPDPTSFRQPHRDTSPCDHLAAAMTAVELPRPGYRLCQTCAAFYGRVHWVRRQP